jgi:hypothetical protein
MYKIPHCAIIFLKGDHDKKETVVFSGQKALDGKFRHHGEYRIYPGNQGGAAHIRGKKFPMGPVIGGKQRCIGSIMKIFRDQRPTIPYLWLRDQYSWGSRAVKSVLTGAWVFRPLRGLPVTPVAGAMECLYLNSVSSIVLT